MVDRRASADPPNLLGGLIEVPCRHSVCGSIESLGGCLYIGEVEEVDSL